MFINISPFVGSYNFVNNFTIVVFPAPFSPIRATFCSAEIENDIPFKIHSSVPGYLNQTSLNSIVFIIFGIFSCFKLSFSSSKFKNSISSLINKLFSYTPAIPLIKPCKDMFARVYNVLKNVKSPIDNFCKNVCQAR